ncbi:MAG: hypothetical protein HKN52_04095 [Eudoraea sp.]|nr:hypothetical protein [Eudoraea sp.]
MKRILIDYKKLDHQLTNLLITNYPGGYGDEDIIAFKNHKGEHIEAVELKTEDSLYLVKISKSLSHFIANFEAIETELKNIDSSNATIAKELNIEAEITAEEELD